MRLRVLAVGRSNRTAWVREAQETYLKRLRRYGRIELVEIRPARGAGSKDSRRAVEDEGTRLLAGLQPRERLLVLAEGGKVLSSAGLAKALTGWQQDSRDLAIAIGGAYGLAPSVLARAEQQLSLSALTLPHLLARVVLLEQLYRAHTMLRGERYHHS